jgi:glycogen operon protein
LSGNYGIEGPTKDASIESVRNRQIKNFLLTLLVSRGVPMLLGGDEFRRTQGGNNNAYCQDNQTSWIDWTDLEKHQEIYRFAQGMIAFRLAHPILSKEQFYTDAGIHWFGPQGGLPKWADPKEKQFACLIHEDEQRALCLLFNAGVDAVDFRLPPIPPGTLWHLAVDTFGETPHDLFAVGREPLLQYQQTYLLKPRSSAILLTRKPECTQEGKTK